MHRFVSKLYVCLMLVVSATLSAFATPVPKPPLVWQLVQGPLNARIEISREGAVFYQLSHGQDILIKPSPLGLQLEDIALNNRFTVTDARQAAERSRYQLAHGKARDITVEAETLALTLQHESGVVLILDFHLQADGLAFRYRLPKQTSLVSPVRILGEHSGFTLAASEAAWMQEYQEPGIFGPAYELNYAAVKPGSHHEGRSLVGSWLNGLLEPIQYQILGSDGWALPALFQVGAHFVLLAEADLDGNYPGSHLDGEPEELQYQLEMPHPEEALGVGDHKATVKLPFSSPWRIVSAGDLKSVVESTIVTDVSLPLDPIFKGLLPAWIEPGVVAWDWWDHLATGDLEQQKRYVDAAAELGWAHIMVDANWHLWNEGNPEPQVKELVAYGAERGVGVLLWYNSGGNNNKVTEAPRDRLDKAERRRAEFALLQSWGVKGIKVDFWHSDKQYLIQQYIDLMHDAAEHQLMVNLHGSTMPRGWRRRFPNMMTMEAVRGAENYQFKPLPGPTATNNLHFAMVRNVVGPMDYTPTVFAAALEGQDLSYGHSLALSVVFESSLQHLADELDNAETGYQKVFTDFPFVKDFVKHLPATWDETLFLTGHPDRHVVLARRKNDVWYVAGIQAGDADLSLLLTLDFLKASSYRIDIIEDGLEPDQLKSRQRTMQLSDESPQGEIVLKLLANGGFLAVFTPALP